MRRLRPPLQSTPGYDAYDGKQDNPINRVLVVE